jgi:hypothetical protein
MEHKKTNPLQHTPISLQGVTTLWIAYPITRDQLLTALYS